MASQQAENRPWAPTVALSTLLHRHRRGGASHWPRHAHEAKAMQLPAVPFGAFLEISFVGGSAIPWRHAPSVPFAASGILGKAASLLLPEAHCEWEAHVSAPASSAAASSGSGAPWASLLDASLAQHPQGPFRARWATAHCDASQPSSDASSKEEGACGAPWVDPLEPRPRLKPVLGAWRPRELAGTFLRCQVLAYLPLLEDYLASDVFRELDESEGEEEEEEEEPAVAPPPKTRDWVKPCLSGCYLTIRECLAQTLRRLIERFLVPRVSNQTACDLTKDTWKLAHDKSEARDKTFAASGRFLGEVFVASLKGHFLGSLSGLLIQLVLDLHEFSSYFVKHRLRIRNHPRLFDTKLGLLNARLLVHSLKSCGALTVACAGAALGSLLSPQPGTLGGFNIGYLLGDTAGAALVDRIAEPYILRLRRDLADAERDSEGPPAAPAGAAAAASAPS